MLSGLSRFVYRRLTPSTIAGQLLVLFGVALVGPVIFTGLLLRDDFQAAAQRGHSDAILAARLAASDIEAAYAANTASARVIEQLPGFWNETDEGRDRLLLAVSAPHKHLNGMIFFTPDLQQHGSAYQEPGGPRSSMAARPYAQEAVRTGQPAFANEIGVSRITNFEILSIVIPLHEPAPGDRIGFVTAAFRMDRFAQLISDVQLPDGSAVRLIDNRNSNLLATVGTPGDASDGVLVAEHSVDGTPWRVVVQIPTAVIYAPIYAGLLQRLVLLAAVSTLITLILLRSWGTLRNRFAIIGRAAERWGHGEWAHRTGLSDRTELGRLGTTLDGMAGQLAMLFARERQIQTDIERERSNREAILASMSDGLVVIGDDLKVAYSNTLAATLLDMDPAALQASNGALLSQHMLERVDDPAALIKGREAAAARLRNGQDARYELTIVGPPRRSLEVRLFPISDNASASHAFGVLLRDRTAELELTRAKNDLLSMVSHDLASPATSVASYAALLAEGDLTESERQQTAATLAQESQRLTAIIQDFVDLRRLEGGHLSVVCKPTDVQSLVEHAAKVASHTTVNHRVELDSPAHLPLVYADRNRTQQVLTNLLTNACKYSPAGGTIRVEARILGDMLELAVVDQGLGIPADALPHLFNRFYRVQTEDRHTISGSGLGLAIARELVEAQRGKIGVVSAGPGHGARFWFTLPIAPSEAETPARGKHRLAVLAVDDDKAIGSAVVRLLRPDGHRVRAVSSGREAVAAVEAERFDVVLLDHGLGDGLDGMSVAQIIRAKRPDIHIVLASGSYFDPAQARTSGIDSILAKPYEPDQLRELLAGLPHAA